MRITKTVYLAGPILDRDRGEANDWRKLAADRLAICGIIGISPLRCEPLTGERYSINSQDPKFGTARAIGAKNLYDVRTCDLTLAYLPTPPAGRERSLGTIAEIGAARILDKPVVIVTDDPFIFDHPVVNAFAGWMLKELDDGIEVAAGLLGGYTGGKNV